MWSKRFADYKPIYFSRRNMRPKACTSGELLPIDINVVSICTQDVEESRLN